MIRDNRTICLHRWEKMEEPRMSYIDSIGIRVYTARCKCKLCGKERIRKFEGPMVGELLR